jgi:hypothetical protein
MYAQDGIEVLQFPPLTFGEFCNFSRGRQRLHKDRFLLGRDRGGPAGVPIHGIQVHGVRDELERTGTRRARGQQRSRGHDNGENASAP